MSLPSSVLKAAFVTSAVQRWGSGTNADHGGDVSMDPVPHEDESGVDYDDLFDEKTNIQYGTFLLRTHAG